MAIAGLVTNQGLVKCIEAMSKGGWKIYPYSFAVSDEIGELEEFRTYDSMKPTWCNLPISGRIVIDAHTIEFLCTIPPQHTNDQRYIREVYIKALDQEGKEFLLAFGQARGDAIYDPSGSVKLRIQISIQNVNMIDLFVFKYTQAQEIFDHNYDPNAHPDIVGNFQKLLEEHNLDVNSHPYLNALIDTLRERLGLLEQESATVTGIQILGASIPLGEKVHLICPKADEVISSDRIVTYRDAKGSLMQVSAESTE